MATFTEAQHLADAFERGDPTIARWQKTLRHVRSSRMAGELFNALRSASHKKVATLAGEVTVCPVCEGAGKAERNIPEHLKDRVPADQPFITTCANCGGSGWWAHPSRI